MKGTVYLIHFDDAYHHAKHYIGWTQSLPARLAEHREGRGARLLEVVRDAGIGWVVARVWEMQSRDFERWLKNRKNAGQLCPICTPGAGRGKGHRLGLRKDKLTGGMKYV